MWHEKTFVTVGLNHVNRLGGISSGISVCFGAGTWRRSPFLRALITEKSRLSWQRGSKDNGRTQSVIYQVLTSGKFSLPTPQGTGSLFWLSRML